MGANRSPSDNTPAPANGGEDGSGRSHFWQRPHLLKIWAVSKDFLSVKNLVIAAMLVVIVFVGFSTGWDRALAEVETEVKLQQLGKPFQAGPFELTIEDISFQPGCVAFNQQFPDCVEVSFQATNTSDKRIEDAAFGTHLLDDRMLLLTTEAGPATTFLPSPSVTRTIDGLIAGAFQPGMSGKYLASWQVPAGTDLCKLQLRVRSATWAKSSLDGHHFWRLEDGSAATIPACGGER
ncbi:MAG: hypothetical protein Q4P06_04370 [Actinomycetaceae bacterium]|nr:hypothetical protein [Actinomycetaceae bacterium]